MGLWSIRTFGSHAVTLAIFLLQYRTRISGPPSSHHPKLFGSKPYLACSVRSTYGYHSFNRQKPAPKIQKASCKYTSIIALVKLRLLQHMTSFHIIDPFHKLHHPSPYLFTALFSEKLASSLPSAIKEYLRTCLKQHIAIRLLSLILTAIS